jgi:hypothetical protein
MGAPLFLVTLCYFQHQLFRRLVHSLLSVFVHIDDLITTVSRHQRHQSWV